MRDFLNIGSSPCDEPCEQVPYQDGGIKAKAECRAYIEAIRRKLGLEPAGAELKIKSFPHDFGTYYEVVCWYEEADVEACQYAFRCESDAPLTWAEVGGRPAPALLGDVPRNWAALGIAHSGQ